MFEIHRGLSPDILRQIFVAKIRLYNHCTNNTLERQQVYSVYHGTESLSVLRPKISNLVPLELKQLEILEVFTLKIKKWIPFECSCRLCRTYIQKLGSSSKTDHDHCYYHFYHLRCLYDNIYK